MLDQRITENFQQQGLMKTLGAVLVSVEKGKVRIDCPWSEKVTQQHGYFHAGVMTSIVDSACGYAALSQMQENQEVLSVEFKINLIRPAKTEKIIAIGEVIRIGKTLTVCEGTVYDETGEVVLAKMLATMIAISR